MISIVKVFVFLVYTVCTIFSTFALQCHTCMFVGGIIGDKSCKDSLHLVKTRSTLRPCNKEGDALNAKEIQTVRFTSPQVQYKVGCLKTMIKAEQLDLVIRGCYGQEILKHPKSSSSPPHNSGQTCQSPSRTFWKQLKDGPLSKAKTPLDITKAKLEVCLCTDQDGCNSASFNGLLWWVVSVGVLGGLFLKEML